MLPFTHADFISVFAAYNRAVWPMQIVAYAIAAIMLLCISRPSPIGSRFAGAALGGLWLWTGITYHGFFFSAINPAAPIFGALFAMQGLWLLHAAVVRPTLRFETRRSGPVAWLGWGLVLYASVLYPLWGTWLGQRWPDMPTMGITPCPLTLFTFGVLLLADTPLPRGLLLIPLLWSLVGGSAAALLDMPPDWPLLFSGFAALPLLMGRRSEGDTLAMR